MLSALATLIVSIVVSLGAFVTSRQFLISERERTALSQTFADAAYLSQSLRSPAVDIKDTLDSTNPPPGVELLVGTGDRWYGTSFTQGATGLPTSVTEGVTAGRTTMAWARIGGEPALVVGVPLVAADAQFYEIVRVSELSGTLATLRRVLVTFAVVGALLGAGFGLAVARRVLRPLEQVAQVTRRVSAGEMQSRLPASDDPDLRPIVESFNSMVVALHERIQRDARFTADVAHELRSPLMTLRASVHVMENRRDELSERTRTALDLISGEVGRLERTLEDLLELGRIDAGVPRSAYDDIDPVELARHTLLSTGRAEQLLVTDPAGDDMRLLGDKRTLSRALVNLLDNADRHAGGVCELQVRRVDDSVRFEVHDAGAGVPSAERDRIFERFVRGPSARSGPKGSGLGLAIVREIASAHGGSVTATSSRHGGACFRLELPASSEHRSTEREELDAVPVEPVR